MSEWLTPQAAAKLPRNLKVMAPLTRNGANMNTILKSIAAILLTMGLLPTALADNHGSAGICLDAGPQTPRDISNGYGLNTVTFPTAPPSTEMNLWSKASSSMRRTL